MCVTSPCPEARNKNHRELGSQLIINIHICLIGDDIKSQYLVNFVVTSIVPKEPGGAAESLHIIYTKTQL